MRLPSDSSRFVVVHSFRIVSLHIAIFCLVQHPSFQCLEAAAIVDSPGSLNVKTGENAALEIMVSGSPVLKTRWFKDNKELSAGAKFQMSFTKKLATLKIRSADSADAGEYKLEVTNHVGTASCNTLLSVSGWWPSCPMFFFS